MADESDPVPGMDGPHPDGRKGNRHTRKVVLLSKMAAAVNLKKSGASYPQIAQALTCSQSTAYRLVQAALRRSNDKLNDDAPATKQLILQRLDAMLLKLWAAINPPNDKPQPEPELLIKLTEQVCRLDDRRARYVGLDKPAPAVVIDMREVVREQLEPFLKSATAEQASAFAAGLRAQLEHRRAEQEKQANDRGEE